MTDTAFSGQNAGFSLTCGFTDPDAGMGTTCQFGDNPATLNPVSTASSLSYTVGQGMCTADAEAMGG